VSVQAGVRELSWIDATGIGHDDVRVTLTESGCVAVGHVTAYEPDRFELYYRVECDSRWRTRSVSIAETITQRSIEFDVTSDGEWIGEDGGILPELDHAVDVDIAGTPFTNTLPIHRLGLDVGESADIVTAWVDVPALHVEADPQRYTRLTPHVYRYESLDSDFTRDIVVDDDGFVLEYPGFFVRRGFVETTDAQGASRARPPVLRAVGSPARTVPGPRFGEARSDRLK
jgi:hypothetical protein